MKIITSISILLLAISFISCNDDETTAEMLCELEISLEPVCSFYPKSAQDVQFPVIVISNDEVIGLTNYSFDWSKDPNFKGSAISVSYVQLPLKLTVTETATGCSAEAVLEKEYWD